VPDT